VNPWKVILATLVIFCSGLVVGALMVKKTLVAVRATHPHVATNAPPSLWHQQQRDFLRRIGTELSLTPKQREDIEKILKQSQERTKIIKEKIAPEMGAELKKVREQIRAELTPAQQQKFEEAMKSKPPRKSEGSNEEALRKLSKEGRYQRTNAPATNVISPANP
jgi:Spy/CpxP family protein refolding chaperone